MSIIHYKAIEHDNRVTSISRITKDYHKVILKPGLWIKPDTEVNGTHACGRSVKGTIDELYSLLNEKSIEFCYCDKCRIAVVEETLKNGSLPDYLQGWNPCS